MSVIQMQHVALNKKYFWLQTARLNNCFEGGSNKSATTEKPETILSQQQDEKDNKLVKGKSMPSLR